jgi:mRNA interferase RelE/StbE
MIVEFDQSFSKSLDKLKNLKIQHRIEKRILDLEKAKSLQDVKSLKKLTGFKKYYRIRIGDYRLGIEQIDEQTIRLIIIAHRKEIYKKFP